MKGSVSQYETYSIYVHMDDVKHLRYMASSKQLPGYLIINTNVPIGKVVYLHQYQDYTFDKRTISYLKSLPYIERNRACASKI
jgi:hypothetical protein